MRRAARQVCVNSQKKQDKDHGLVAFYFEIKGDTYKKLIVQSLMNLYALKK
jgi:hypothetical protein